jgi:hypothetical protein
MKAVAKLESEQEQERPEEVLVMERGPVRESVRVSAWELASVLE